MAILQVNRSLSLLIFMTKLILFKIGLFGFFSIIANAQDVNNETSKPSLNNIIPKKNQKKITTEDDQNLRLRILSYNIHHAEESMENLMSLELHK